MINMTNTNNNYHSLHDNNSETGMFFLMETNVDILHTRGTSNKKHYQSVYMFSNELIMFACLS
jgi:hypothetical protein